MSEDRKKELRCSFCGKSEHEVHRMIQGAGVRICDECVRLCMEVLEDGYESHEGLEAPESIPTPREIHDVLDQYIIGQEAAKIALSVSVYNHYKRIFFGGDDDVEHFLKIKQRLNKILAENTGKTPEQVKLDSERDHWMSADEAQEYGLVDKVIYKR